MNILQLMPSKPEHIPAPVLGHFQVVGGPHYSDTSENGRVISLSTGFGEYDVRELVRKLPADQYPDLLIARVGTGAISVPQNIGALHCRTVLAVGDTHHLSRPIRRLLDYALAEPFDFVMLQQTRQHAHYFVEAGCNVFWLPRFYVQPIVIDHSSAPDIPLSFIGQMGKFHPRRTAIARAMCDAGLPLQLFTAFKEDARRIHGRTQVNFNCTLNGDLNMRVFEVLASGGCLLTDRLSPQAGLDLFFEDGKEMLTYTSPADCIEKSRSLLSDPERARQIAAAGKSALESRLGPEKIGEELFSIIDKGNVRPEFDLSKDGRLRLERARTRTELMDRIAIYETVQELHRTTEFCRILAMPAVDARIVTDCADLPRFSLAVNVGTSSEHSAEWNHVLKEAGISRQVELISDPRGRSWDLVLATMEDWRDQKQLGAVLNANRGAALLIAEKSAESADRELLARGFMRLARNVPLFCRPNAVAA